MRKEGHNRSTCARSFNTYTHLIGSHQTNSVLCMNFCHCDLLLYLLPPRPKGVIMATQIPAHITIILSLLLLRLLTLTSTTQDDLIVATAKGKVRGVRLSVPGSGSILAFLGIPYGKPPIGQLRFRSPEPVEEWAGVKDATHFPNSCCQPLDTAFPGHSHTPTRLIYNSWKHAQ